MLKIVPGLSEVLHRRWLLCFCFGFGFLVLGGLFFFWLVFVFKPLISQFHKKRFGILGLL